MIPVEDMRPCPWCRETRPVDHDCVGDTPDENAPDPMSRAEGGNPHNEEIELSTQFIDTPAFPLTRASARYIHDRLGKVENDVAGLRAEIASLEVILGDLEDTAARYRARLDAGSSLLPSSAELASQGELPVEAEAHAAVAEQSGQEPRGEHPYGPATVPDLPPFATGHVHISAPGWTGPAADGEAGR